MPTISAAKTVEARQKQREYDKRATWDQLIGKKRATEEISLNVPDGNGGSTEVTMLFQAIGTREYDKLLAKHPPKAEQKLEGASYDINSFGPDIIHKCAVEPELSIQEARQLWDSDDWSRGEIMTLFRAAVEVCNRGLDIPFTGND